MAFCLHRAAFIVLFGLVLSSCSVIMQPGSSNAASDSDQIEEGSGAGGGEEVSSGDGGNLSAPSPFLQDEMTAQLTTSWESSLPIQFRDNSTVADGSTADSFSVVVAAAADVAIVVWRQSDGNYNRYYRSVYRAGEWTHPLGPKDSLVLRVENQMTHLGTRISASGEEAAIYWRDDGDLKLLLYANGQWTTEPATVSSDISSSDYFDLQISYGGELLAVAWAHEDSSNDFQMFYASYNFSDDSWNRPANSSDGMGPEYANGIDKVDLALSRDGAIALVGVQHEDSSNQDQVSIFELNSGTWSTPSSVDDTVSFNSNQARLGAVALSHDGSQALVAWEQLIAAGDEEVFLASKSGIAWTLPSSIADFVSHNSTAAVSNLDVALDADGDNALLVWGEAHSGAPLNRIFRSTMTSGVWDHPESATDTLSSGRAFEPRIATESVSSTALITWVETDGVNYRINAEFFDGTAWRDSSQEGYLSASAGGLSLDDNFIALGNGGDLALAVHVQDYGTWGGIDYPFVSIRRAGSWSVPSGVEDHISVPIRKVIASSIEISDDASVAVMAWMELRGNIGCVRASTFQGGVWTHPLDHDDCLNPDDQAVAGGYQYVDVALSGDGSRALVSWLAYRSSGFSSQRVQPYVAEFSGGSWSTPSGDADSLTALDLGSAYVLGLDVDLDYDGTFGVLTWAFAGSGSGTSYPNIYKAIFEDGSWSVPASSAENLGQRVQTFNFVFVAPTVAVSQSGNKAVVVYGDTTPTHGSRVYRATYDGSSWSLPSGAADSLVDHTETSYFGSVPLLSLSADGNDGFLAWGQLSVGGEYYVYHSTLSAGVWTDPSNVNDYVVASAGTTGTVEGGMTSDGSYAFFVWSTSDGSRDQVYMSEFNGAAWSSPANSADSFTSFTGDEVIEKVSAGLDASGYASIVFAVRDGSRFSAERSGGTWDTDFQDLGVSYVLDWYSRYLVAPFSMESGQLPAGQFASTVLYTAPLVDGLDDTGLRFMQALGE